MPIAIQCPACQRKATVPDAAAGKNVRCQCGNLFKVAGSPAAQTQGDPTLELAPAAAPPPQSLSATPDAAALQAMRESVFKNRVCPVCHAPWPNVGGRCGQCNWDMLTGKHVAAIEVRQAKATAPARELVPGADYAEGGTPQLWNPNAAANWSVVFSPIFGAVLHAANWRALGKPERASANMIWAWVTAGLALVNLLRLFLPENGTRLNPIVGVIGLGLLLGWYFTQGKPQIKYVKETLPAGYARRSWGTPLGIGVAGVIVYLALAVGLAMAIGSGSSGKLKAFNAYIAQVMPLLVEQDGMVRRFAAFEKNASEKAPSKEGLETFAAEMARQAAASLSAFRSLRPEDTEVAELHSIWVTRAEKWQSAMTAYPRSIHSPDDEAAKRTFLAECKAAGDCLARFKSARDAFLKKHGIGTLQGQ